MANDLEASQDEVLVLARLVRLDLSPDRLTALISSLSNHLARMERLREIDPCNHEPPVITLDDEAKT